MAAIMTVLVFPPRESCKSLVSFESLNGTCWLPVTKDLITLPKAERERLILVASLRRTPSALVLDWRSEPAKSTKFNLPALNLYLPSTWEKRENGQRVVPSCIWNTYGLGSFNIDCENGVRSRRCVIHGCLTNHSQLVSSFHDLLNFCNRLDCKDL